MKIKKIIIAIMIVAIAAAASIGLMACQTKKIEIGVQSGTTGESYVKGDAEWGFAGIANAKAVGFQTIAQAVEDMINGNIDYCIVDKAPAQAIAASKSSVKVIDIALTVEEYAIAVKKDDVEMMTKINAAISKMKSDGTLGKIYEAYAGISSEDNIPAESTGFVGVTSAKKDAAKAQLIVATNASFAPYEYKVGEEYYGIDMEMAKIIADELGLELVIENMEFDSVVLSVNQGKCDVGIACLTVNAARKQSVNFSDAYETGAMQVVMVKADNTEFDNCKTKEDVLKVFADKK